MLLFKNTRNRRKNTDLHKKTQFPFKPPPRAKNRETGNKQRNKITKPDHFDTLLVALRKRREASTKRARSEHRQKMRYVSQKLKRARSEHFRAPPPPPPHRALPGPRRGQTKSAKKHGVRAVFVKTWDFDAQPTKNMEKTTQIKENSVFRSVFGEKAGKQPENIENTEIGQKMGKTPP